MEKRALTMLVVIMSLLVVASASADSTRSLPDPGDDPMGIVYYEISRQVVGVMPYDSLYPNLTMGEIEGDDGRLDAALRAAIGAVTDYRFLEFADLQTLLQAGTTTDDGNTQQAAVSGEDKQQSGDAAKGVRRPGWMLTGKFLDKVEYPVFYSAEVYLEMKNLVTGEVAFGRAFSAAFIPSFVKYVAIVVMLAVVVLLFFVVKIAGRRRKIRLSMEEDNRAQLAISNEVRKTRENLKRVQDNIAKIDVGLAARVREQQSDMQKLLQEVESHPGIHLEYIDTRITREQAKHNKFMLGLVRNLSAESENLLHRTSTGKLNGIDSVLADVDREIKNCLNKMYDNKAGRA